MRGSRATHGVAPSTQTGVPRNTVGNAPQSGLNLGTKKSGKGRRKQGRKKRRMRAKIRHRKK
jgi:hypothetical protein